MSTGNLQNANTNIINVLKKSPKKLRGFNKSNTTQNKNCINHHVNFANQTTIPNNITKKLPIASNGDIIGLNNIPIASSSPGINPPLCFILHFIAIN